MQAEGTGEGLQSSDESERRLIQNLENISGENVEYLRGQLVRDVRLLRLIIVNIQGPRFTSGLPDRLQHLLPLMAELRLDGDCL